MQTYNFVIREKQSEKSNIYVITIRCFDALLLNQQQTNFTLVFLIYASRSLTPSPGTLLIIYIVINFVPSLCDFVKSNSDSSCWSYSVHALTRTGGTLVSVLNRSLSFVTHSVTVLTSPA